MRSSKHLKLMLSVIIVSLMFILSACIVTKDSPAPGCVESIGLPTFGGCSGKTAIIDLSVNPKLDCLTINANNCNGGVLEIHNACQETLILDDIEILSAGSASLDVFEDTDGIPTLNEVWSNFSDYIPTQNTVISTTGILGNQKLEITFTKSAKLCN